MEQVFKFKRFSIDHSCCAMKVGTDAIMLGAWVGLDNVSDTLDIGTGTGILSLIIAQRSKLAEVVALELDSTCAQQAQKNFKASGWSNRLTCLNVDAKEWQGDRKFDLIISNPPYFDKGIRSKDSARRTARHTDSLSLSDLFHVWMVQGSNNSTMALVLPYSALTTVQQLCDQYQTFIWRQLEVSPKPDVEPNRLLLQLSKNAIEPEYRRMNIYDGTGGYTDAYKQLTIELYLGL